MYDVFLSYSSKDRERLLPLFHGLEKQGWSVFWDHRTIEIGDTWSRKIDRAIRTSKCVVVVWSESSVDSEWVLEEANIGKLRDVLLPIQIDAVLLPVGFTMRQTGNLINWDGDAKYPEFIRLLGKVRELVEQHDAAIAEQAKRETEVAAAEQERLAQEKAEAERQAREQAEKQRRLEEEARQRREVAEAAERERVAKEKAAAEQKAREAADRQRWLEESQARLAAEEAAKQKKLEQERAAEQKAREERAEAERQAKAKQEQIKREQAAAEAKARQDAERQTTINDPEPPGKKFPLIPTLLLSAAVLGGGGYLWHETGKHPPVGASPAGDPPPLVPQNNAVAVPAPEVVEPEMVPKMVPLDGGIFTMGCDPKRDDVEGGCDDDEKPAHKVTLKAFKLAKTETTVAQFRAFVDATGYKTTAEEKGSCWGDKTGKGDWDYVDGNFWKKPGFEQTDNDPVVCVSWDDTQKYLEWLNSTVKPDKPYRLPTEAEWEYAARGGKGGAYPWGQKGADGCSYANMADQKAKEKYSGWTTADCNDGYIYTAPVGKLQPNGYGFYDMHGNVWEWVQDRYAGDYYKSSPASAPEGPKEGALRVIRGGSWGIEPRDARSANRSWDSPDARLNLVGFRLAQGQ